MAEAVRKLQIDDAEAASNGGWARVLGRFKREVGEAAYRSWLRPVSLRRVDDGEAVIAAPTRFLRDWIATHYADRLLALWRIENREMRRVLVVVSVAEGATETTAATARSPRAAMASAGEP